LVCIEENMNGRVSKLLRKSVYGIEYSPKDRKYSKDLSCRKIGNRKIGDEIKKVIMDMFTVRNIGLRQRYFFVRKKYKTLNKIGKGIVLKGIKKGLIDNVPLEIQK